MHTHNSMALYNICIQKYPNIRNEILSKLLPLLQGTNTTMRYPMDMNGMYDEGQLNPNALSIEDINYIVCQTYTAVDFIIKEIGNLMEDVQLLPSLEEAEQIFYNDLKSIYGTNIEQTTDEVNSFDDVKI